MVPFPCKKCRCSYNPSSVLIFWWCFIFVPSFVKISHQFPKLLSWHYFQTEIFKGHNSTKNKGRVKVLNLCTSSHDALYLVNICTKFHQNILDCIKVIERTQFTWEKIWKGHNSIKNVDRVTILFLCTMSDDALYLYKVSWKYSRPY